MSVKIIHITDIHIRALERHDEYRFVFSELINKIKEIKPDIIVNTGDTWHTKLQHITPEGIRVIREFFTQLADYAPVLSIYGNHDLNLQNKDRHNIIWEIINSVSENKKTKFECLLLDKSIPKQIDINDKSIIFYPFSMTDEESWVSLREQVKRDENIIPISLFHGSIQNVELDNGFALQTGELERDNFLFNEFPFVMLGDIHKRQYLAYRRNVNNEIVPYAAYAGSLIQQDFGESIDSHGFLLWEIENQKTWKITEFDIYNPYQKHTVTWEGVQKTFQEISNLIINNNLDNRISLRIKHPGIIFASETNEIKQLVKTKFGIDNIQFSHVNSKELDEQIINEIKPNIIIKTNKDLLYNFIETNSNIKSILKEEDYSLLDEFLIKIENQSFKQEENPTERLLWKIKELWFDNIFGYGEGNYINFENFSGNIGIFGQNRLGKSACLAAICYALFNSTDRGSLKELKGFNVINENKQFCRAKIKIEVENQNYIIERSTKRGQKEVTNTKVKFYKLEKDGTLKKLTGDSRDDTDKKIKELIGTFQDFETTSFASQNRLLSFIEKGSTECKKMLSRYFNIDSYLNIGLQASKLKEKSIIEIGTQTETTFIETKLRLTNEIDLLKNSIIENQNKLFFAKERLLEAKNNISNLKINEYKEYNSNVELLKKIEKDIVSYDELINSYIEKQNEFETIIIETDEIIAKDKHSIDEKNKLEAKIEELSTQIEQINQTKKTLNKKLKLLDEIPCGTQFPTCSFIKDSFEAKNKLPEIDMLLQSILNTYQAQKASLGDLDNLLVERYQSAQRRQEKAYRELESNKKLLDAKKTLKNNELLNKQKLQTRQSFLETIGANLLLEEQIKLFSIKVEEENKHFNHLNNEINNLNHKIESLEKEKEILETNYQMFLVKTKELRVLTVIADCFSKNGVPAQILRDYMDSINFFAGLVTKDTDFDIKVKVDPESNSLDIDYICGSNRRPIETCSGAEKTFAALALRIALIQCGSIPISNSLFLDECFGSLDEEMIVIAGQLLSSLETYFDIIFVISHESYIKEITNTQMEVKKNKIGYSEIISGQYNNPHWTDEP